VQTTLEFISLSTSLIHISYSLFFSNVQSAGQLYTKYDKLYNINTFKTCSTNACTNFYMFWSNFENKECR